MEGPAFSLQVKSSQGQGTYFEIVREHLCKGCKGKHNTVHLYHSQIALSSNMLYVTGGVESNSLCDAAVRTSLLQYGYNLHLCQLLILLIFLQSKFSYLYSRNAQEMVCIYCVLVLYFPYTRMRGINYIKLFSTTLKNCQYKY